MVSEAIKRTLPPYVSYRTFRSFIDGLESGIPARIDRSYWGDKVSGSSGTQLMTALRFLGLIDGNGIPTTRLTQLVSAKGTQKSEILRQIACTTFDFLIARSLNPQVATYAQLEEAFYNTYHVTGDVARKCIKFFINLANEAGIPLSSFIIKKTKKLAASGGRKSTTTKMSARTNWNTTIPFTKDQIPVQIVWCEMVLDKFPTFDPNWSDEIKLKWFEAFDTILKRGLLPETQK